MDTIRLGFTPLDLTRTRFAFSPLWEAVMSVRAWQHPDRFAIHLPWLRQVPEALAGLDLTPVLALVRPSGYIPDFLTPPPRTPLPDLEAELTALRASDPALVRREVARTYTGGAMPEAARSFLACPEAALDALVSLLRAYWERALAPHWSRLRTILENDLLIRARRLALYGPEAMFSDLSPLVSYEGGVLQLHKSLCRTPARVGEPRPACCARQSLELDGRGLLLMPSAFVWPSFSLILEEPWQPTLAYTPRGVATLWDEPTPLQGPALDLLLGRGRASVLMAVRQPVSTQEVAQRLHLAPSSVSEHLGVLRQTELVETRRQGRAVLYRLSPRGCALLDLLGATPEEGAALEALLIP